MGKNMGFFHLSLDWNFSQDEGHCTDLLHDLA